MMLIFGEKGEAQNPKNTVPTVKCGGGSFMSWGFFSASGSGFHIKVKGIRQEGRKM